MRPRLFVVISTLALILAGCDPKPTITEGTVTEKGFHIPPTRISYYEVCFTSENQTRCEKVSKDVYNQAKVGEWFVLP